jgi:hypothetical protein
MNTLVIWLLSMLAWSGLVIAQTNFSIQSIQHVTNGETVLSWPSVPNVTYNVQFALSAGGPWYDFPDGRLPAYTTSLVYTDSSFVLAPQVFYRLRKNCSRIVTIILDRSGSMAAPGVLSAIEAGITNFLSGFSETNDSVGLVSFSTISTVDVPTGSPFKSQIAVAVSSMLFSGSTFMQGGLTNALVEEQSVVVLPSESPSMAVVLVTDGAPNTIQDTFNCADPTLWNYGGVDSGPVIDFFNPTNGTVLCSTTGGVPPCCPETTMFPSIDGTSKSFTAANVNAEAAARSIQFANGIRSQGIAVYTIGLGVGVDETFLQEVANDPLSPVYNPAQPQGKAVFATALTGLSAAFQQVANQILSNCPP